MSKVVLSATLTFLVGCGGSPPVPSSSAGPATEPTRVPSHVILRVDNVVVAPVQSTGKPWDAEPGPSAGAGADCSLLGKVIGLALTSEIGALAPLVGEGANLLCRGASRSPQLQRDPTNPDLQVRIGTADGTPYVTEVVPDVTQALFGRAFVVPMEAVPRDGLIVQVVDDDLTSGFQQIGAVRVTRDEIAKTLSDRSRLLVREQKPSLVKLEIFVDEYTERATTTINMDAITGTQPNVTDVVAGEVVSITASGHYRVGTWYDADVTPVGYPGGGPRDYNFKYEPLRSAPHACGFALLGEHTRSAALVNPYASFVAPMPGPLLVGINDSDPSNNSGSVMFTILRRAPTTAEWRAHRAE